MSSYLQGPSSPKKSRVTPQHIQLDTTAGTVREQEPEPTPEVWSDTTILTGAGTREPQVMEWARILEQAIDRAFKLQISTADSVTNLADRLKPILNDRVSEGGAVCKDSDKKAEAPKLVPLAELLRHFTQRIEELNNGQYRVNDRIRDIYPRIEV